MNILRNSRGFTLLEVLVSIIILSISLLVFNTFFVNNITQNSRQENKQIAVNIARQKIAEVKDPKIIGEDLKLDEIVYLETSKINNLVYTSCGKVTKFEPLYLITVHVYQGETCQNSNLLSTLHTSIPIDSIPKNQ